MQKSLIFLALILLVSVYMSALSAQSFFDFTNKNSQSALSATPPPNRPLSPDEFKDQVRALNQQTQAELKQQVDALHSNTPPVATQQLPEPPAGTEGNNNGYATSGGSNVTVQTTPAKPMPPIVPQQYQRAPQNNSNVTVTTPQSTGPIVVPGASSTQSQVYTGFRTPDQNQNAPKNNTQNSNGWNIRY